MLFVAKLTNWDILGEKYIPLHTTPPSAEQQTPPLAQGRHFYLQGQFVDKHRPLQTRTKKESPFGLSFI